MADSVNLTEIEKAMLWERMSGNMLSDEHRQRILDGEAFQPPQEAEEGMAILINPETVPVRENHICFFTKEANEYIILCEVVECFYPHPDAPENALIQRLEIREIEERSKNSIGTSSFLLLQLAQNNLFSYRCQPR